MPLLVLAAGCGTGKKADPPTTSVAPAELRPPKIPKQPKPSHVRVFVFDGDLGTPVRGALVHVLGRPGLTNRIGRRDMSVADFRRVRDALAAGARRVVVVGGGFIGSEIAASLAANEAAVTMIFPKEAICPRAFPPDLARFVTEYYRDKGVVIWSREKLAQLTQRADGLALRTVGGQETVADLVVVGLGIVPSAELAQKAGLAVGDGIQVDAGLRTSDPAIWAAGDVASFVSPALEKRVRVEHEDNALTMGRLAGRAMAGDAVSYQHLPFFYSDLFDLGYEAVGELDARHEVVSDWKLPFREGIVYFLSRGRVRGVLLWNVWGQVEAARALIRDERPASIRGPLALPDASGTASV